MLTNDSKKIVKFIDKSKSLGFKELKELFNHLNRINNKHDKVISSIKNYPILQSPFISNELSIKANSLKDNHYTILTVHNSKIHVNIFYDNLNIHKFIKIIIPIISYVANLIKKIDGEYHINYYLVDDKKLIDNDTQQGLKHKHINSGSCGMNTINIWRKEEVIKVTIHELFHLFNCDSRIDDPPTLIKEYQKRYNITSQQINSFESYTEIWANIINCFLLSGNDYKNFVHNLSIEKSWCEFQAQKIFYLNKDIKDINQNTNVLAYFIIRCEIYNNFKEFIKLFGKRICCNSDVYFRFLRNNKICSKKDVIKKINKKTFIYKTLRMSALEYKSF
jgi:hypothetical protein